MMKLLRERFRKYFKSPVFYAMLASSAAAGVILNVYSDRIGDIASLVPYILTVMAAAAAFIPARDRTDGIIRNNILTGSGRVSVFFSEMIPALTVSAICFIIMTAVSALTNPSRIAPLFDEVCGEWYRGLYISCAVTFFMLTLATSSFAAAVGMLAPRRAAAVIAAMAVFASMLASAYTYSRLGADEYIVTYEYDHSEPVPRPIGEGTKTPNPDYVGGMRRTVLDFALKASPTGQLVMYNSTLSPAIAILNPRLGNGGVPDPLEFEKLKASVKVDAMSPVLSLLCIAAVCAVGAAVFAKRDIE